MVALGVDLASQAGKTAACLIRWDGEKGYVDPPTISLEDSHLLDLFNCPETRPGKNGQFVEVYPAAALKVWGLLSKGGGKGKGPEKEDERDKLVCALARKAGLTIEKKVRLKFRESDDKFDALVAALVTRAAAIGCCEEIPPEDRKRAKREGWIALPKPGSLARLATNCPDS